MAFSRFAIAALMLALSGSVALAQDAPKDSSPLGNSKSQDALSAAVPESEAELRSQLEKILDLEQHGNAKEAKNAIEAFEIPEDSGWFTRVFGAEFGTKLAASYKLTWDNFREMILLQFRSDAKEKGLSVRVIDSSDPSGQSFHSMASSVVSAMKTPTSFYMASVVGVKGRAGPLPGLYVYVQGAFRIVSWETLYELPNVKPMRIRVDGNVAQSSIVHQANPVLPPGTSIHHLQGTVMLHAVIGVDGTIQQLEVVNSSQVDPILYKAALEAVNQWRYKPTLVDGAPVEVDTTIYIAFSSSPR
jgi:TonB family protein